MNYRKVAIEEFPTQQNVNINMMPFIMGDSNSIPSEYRQYSGMIDACDVPDDEIGKIGFLTVNESMVKAGCSQRRAGLHVEKHPERSWGGGAWGGGKKHGSGIYMASDVTDSCFIWDDYVKTPNAHGECEHLRDSLEGRVGLKAGELVWLTDGTPHEAVKSDKDEFRQFFRLVTSDVFGWYRQHSTENRLGVIPACSIIEDNKFETI